ncbi:MAG: hypothetical protein MHM6MM_006979 [Cercozoa sp. M6MM]
MEKRRRGRSRVLSISSNPLRSDRLFLAPSLTQELGPETRRPRRRFSRLEADENAPPSALNVSLEGSEEVLHESDTCFSFSTPIDTPTTRYHSTPERILDAPGLVDDFYTNCLHWSRPLDSVVVALGGAVYLWNSAKGSISQLCDLADERVTSVRCQPEYAPTSSGMLPPLRTRSLSTHAVSEKPLLDSAKTHVAVGTSRGALRLFDAASCRIVPCILPPPPPPHTHTHARAHALTPLGRHAICQATPRRRCCRWTGDTDTCWPPDWPTAPSDCTTCGRDDTWQRRFRSTVHLMAPAAAMRLCALLLSRRTRRHSPLAAMTGATFP